MLWLIVLYENYTTVADRVRRSSNTLLVESGPVIAARSATNGRGLTKLISMASDPAISANPFRIFRELTLRAFAQAYWLQRFSPLDIISERTANLCNESLLILRIPEGS